MRIMQARERTAATWRSKGAREVTILRRAPSACWQDGGKEKSADVLRGQAVKLLLDRLQLLSKASTPKV